MTITANKTEEIIKPIEASNPENVSQIPIPSALITSKPPVNVEQQRAIITRVTEFHKHFYILKNTIFR
jgi:hypothetical protein